MPTPALYDTTLRDGTQGSGVSFSVEDKLRIAARLDAFGIGYIEGGWPGSNPKDIAFFAAAATRTWRHARLAAFGSTRRGGVRVQDDAQVGLLLAAQTPVVTIVGKSWRLHVREVLGVEEEENRAMISDTVHHLRAAGREVFYDAEHFFDGFADDPAHALGTLRAAAEAGAHALVLCDTNGGTLPARVAVVTAAVCAAFPDVQIGIHTHNDGGLGVANALAALQAGATQVQGTINGYGERTGNCNLTTLIPLLQAKLGWEVVPDLAQLTEVSRFVDELANLPPDPRAPFVGDHAFAHKGGLHAHAVQKLAHSYEHLDPATVGNRQRILVSELSGQSNVLSRAAALGLPLEKGSPEVARILRRIKELENEGWEFEAAEASFDLLVRRALGRHHPLFELLDYHCVFRRDGAGLQQNCEATVKLRLGGEIQHTVASGDGPVHALDAALRKALRPLHPAIDGIALTDYKVRIIDGHRATAARTRVHITSQCGSESWSTVGVSDNIIEASWQALVEGLEYGLAPR
ncbi:MAG: citramalate synthase [Verrucomicrobia bacterium]|nr:citramalate synthase [Verrucomicrobiota bacterium]